MDTAGWARASHVPLGMEATRIPTGVTQQRSEGSSSWRARPPDLRSGATTGARQTTPFQLTSTPMAGTNGS